MIQTGLLEVQKTRRLPYLLRLQRNGLKPRLNIYHHAKRGVIRIGFIFYNGSTSSIILHEGWEGCGGPWGSVECHRLCQPNLFDTIEKWIKKCLQDNCL